MGRSRVEMEGGQLRSEHSLSKGFKVGEGKMVRNAGVVWVNVDGGGL